MTPSKERVVLDECSAEVAAAHHGSRFEGHHALTELISNVTEQRREAFLPAGIDGAAITGTRYAAPAAVRTRIGVLFQSPRAAADPPLSLADLIAEPCVSPGTHGTWSAGASPNSPTPSV